MTQTGGSSKNGNLMMPASDLKSSEFVITDLLLDIDHGSLARPMIDKRDKYTPFAGRDCLTIDGVVAAPLDARAAITRPFRGRPQASVDLHLAVIF
jgi:hypothetical protein